MRISDWSSDVCSSDLSFRRRTPARKSWSRLALQSIRPRPLRQSQLPRKAPNGLPSWLKRNRTLSPCGRFARTGLTTRLTLNPCLARLPITSLPPERTRLVSRRRQIGRAAGKERVRRYKEEQGV